MGTRADFYVGRGDQAEWLGSIGWDGYPDGIESAILEAKSEDGFRGSVAVFMESREDATLPSYGWPWPWNDSRTTDYAYAFDDGQTWVACFGAGWYAPDDWSDERADMPKQEFPDMSALKNISLGRRSGLITITEDGIVED